MIEDDPAALSLLADLVARARRAGADEADALLADNIALSVAYRLGKPERIERAEAGDISLRVFLGKRQAMVSSSERTPAALEALVERAVAMARSVPEDPYCGLAAPEDLARAFPDLDVFDAAEPSADALVDLARRAEDAARAVEGVTNSEGAEAGWNSSTQSWVASNGFAHTYRSTGAQFSAAVIAGNADGMERDYDWSAAVHFADLQSPEEIGASAGRRAVHRLGSRKPPSAQVPVVYDPRVARSLLGHLAGAINGTAIARGTSFLLDRLGKQVLPKGSTVIDDPHRKRGLRSRPCDGEGMANRRLEIVADGVLTTWLLDLRSARQLGLRGTGHGARGGGASASNLWLVPGAAGRTELIADIASGLYVTELIGMGVNGVTGDYSRGAAGFWIDKGEIAWPVSEVTVAGNLKDMFQHLAPANDLEFRTGIDAPTLRVEGMTVAGA